MKESLPENEELLNQLAKKALKALKIKTEYQDLYVLQLMNWVLWERKEWINRHNLPDLQDAVEYWLRQDPKVVMEYLLKETPLGDRLFVAESLEKENLEPEDLALHLVDQLHYRMARDDLGYPPGCLQAVWPMT